jgi:hypothetical protein
VSLESGADYEVTKQTIEKQGRLLKSSYLPQTFDKPFTGGTVVDDSARFLGVWMIWLQISTVADILFSCR